jgi:hypothetical protein
MKGRPHPLVLATSMLLAACGSASYTVDSATSSCRQNPIYCSRVAGEEAVVPTIRGTAEMASVAATLRVLTADTKSSIEEALKGCAEWAHETVNRHRFGGNPSRAQCQEELPEKDPCGRKLTRAMQVGQEKHRLALQCTQQRLGALIPERFSLEQRYRYDKQTRKRELVSHEEARTLRRQGCGDELEGTIVPDVVIHTGNPLEPLAVYDFKFPCPISNTPRWRQYAEGPPHNGASQGDVYNEALGVKPHLVAPRYGIIP